MQTLVRRLSQQAPSPSVRLLVPRPYVWSSLGHDVVAVPRVVEPLPTLPHAAPGTVSVGSKLGHTLICFISTDLVVAKVFQLLFFHDLHESLLYGLANKDLQDWLDLNLKIKQLEKQTRQPNVSTSQSLLPLPLRFEWPHQCQSWVE